MLSKQTVFANRATVLSTGGGLSGRKTNPSTFGTNLKTCAGVDKTLNLSTYFCPFFVAQKLINCLFILIQGTV